VPPAADALAHLTEISTQIEAAVVLDREGGVQAATVDDERAGRIARAALELFRQADAQREQELVQLDAALAGSVFVVRDEERLIAATTGPGPTAGLVFYDLKSALRSFAEPKPKPKPKPKPRTPAKRATTRRKKDDASA
jgi:hypothetical protein